MQTATRFADPRAALRLLASALVAAWWIAYFPLPFLEFYKEWVFAAGLAVAALVGLRPVALRDLARHPLLLGAAATALAVVLQAALRPEHAPRGALYLGYVALFVLALACGAGMRRQFGDEATVALAWTLLIGVTGSAFFAALQLNGIEFDLPIVASRGRRITSNLAQANHLANLLWLGGLAAVYLVVRRPLHPAVMGALLALLLALGHLTGSRMSWLYAATTLGLGLLAWRWGGDARVRRMGPWMVAVALAFAALASVQSAAGVANLFGLVSGGSRLSETGSDSSDNKRLWYAKVAVDAARQEPLLGVGAGRYGGHGFAMSIADAASPDKGATTNAHNLTLQLAAELGLPAAIAVTLALGVWLAGALWRARRNPEALFAAACGCVLLTHAMLEYPFWYAYFLGLFGLIAGLQAEPNATASPGPWRVQRVLPVAVLAGTLAAHVLVRPIENAMQVVVLQIGVGGAPQPSPDIERGLARVPTWSPYHDWAEAVDLTIAVPDQGNAADLAARCDLAMRFAPTPYVLARCATAHQVAGNPARATELANALCRLYPWADLTLIQSMTFVQRVSPAAGDIVSTCVERWQ